MEAFKQWRHYCDGAQHEIEVYTDHDNLRGITKLTKLNARQARYTMTLALFDFRVYYRLGNKNPAGAPSRRPDYMSDDEQHINELLLSLIQKLSVQKQLEVELNGASLGNAYVSSILVSKCDCYSCSAHVLSLIDSNAGYAGYTNR